MPPNSHGLNGNGNGPEPRRERLAAVPWLLPILHTVLMDPPTNELLRWTTGGRPRPDRMGDRETWLIMLLSLEGELGRPRDARELRSRVSAMADWYDALPRDIAETLETVLGALDRYGWVSKDLVDCERWAALLAYLEDCPPGSMPTPERVRLTTEERRSARKRS